MTETVAAYIAGIIDADGSLYAYTFLRKAKPGWKMNGGISVEMISEDLLRWMAKETGRGNLTKQRIRAPRRRPVWSWHIALQQAASLLGELRPFLRLKRDQTDLIIELAGIRAEGLRRNRCKQFLPERQLEIVRRLHELNTGLPDADNRSH